MKEKTTPIERPTRKPYLVCDLGDHGKFTFKLPSPGRAQSLMRAYTSIDNTVMEEVENAAGDVIKECWADGTHDLEGGTGAEVFKELWEQGWPFDLLIGLVAAIIDEMNATFISEAEVGGRVAFFGRTPGPNTSTTSDTSTSKTSGDTTN